jgi:hypothetical protein
MSEQEQLKQEIIEKVLDADFKNIVKKVKDGKTLSSIERKTLEDSRQKPKWEVLDIHKTTYYKYKKLGMPDEFEEAKKWMQLRNGMAQQGSGKIEIGGRTFTAQNLIDLRGKLLEGQAENVSLKNRIENLNVQEREGKLVDVDALNETLVKILYPLRKALDQMPENIASAVNPDDPSRAETIIEQELENIYADLVKTLSQDERTKKISM